MAARDKPMTVQELIAALQGLPAGALVVFPMEDDYVEALICDADAQGGDVVLGWVYRP